MDVKQELREFAKGKRRTLDIGLISEEIVNNIRCSEVYRNSKEVMIFYPLANEVNLLGLLEDEKNFYLPRMKGENLEICPYKAEDELKSGKYNIKEPISAGIVEFYPDIVFVPALCADVCCNRIGYGGGYYDRLVYNIRSGGGQTQFIIAVPEELLVSDIPVCSTDRKCDGIVTQKKASFLRG